MAGKEKVSVLNPPPKTTVCMDWFMGRVHVVSCVNTTESPPLALPPTEKLTNPPIVGMPTKVVLAM